MAWWVYLLHCGDDTYYCGITTDPDQRLHDHNNTQRGAAYTRTRRPVKLVWKEEAESKGAALRREHEIKKMTRRQKELLVKSYNGNEDEAVPVKVLVVDTNALDTDDANMHVLWATLTLLRELGKKPVLWKLSDELIESAAHFLHCEREDAATGELWGVSVDATSALPSVIVDDGEVFPVYRC